MNETGELLKMFFADKWVELGTIVVLFFLGKMVLGYLVQKAICLVDDGDDSTDTVQEKQARTLGDLILQIGNIAIYLIILLMVLQLFSINITPILAGAGVVGVAIGFGAQTLVKDLLSGVFIILEHRYALGDHVKIDIFEGEVVKITMRSTVLRNAEGQTFYISNGSIPKVINSSQDHLEASK